MTRARVLVALAVTAFVFADPASGQTDYTWTSQAAGNWSAGTNWLGGTAPPFGGDPLGTFIFQGSGFPTATAFTATNDLGAASFNVIRFESSLTGTGGFTVNSAALNSLSATGANAEIQQAGLGLATFGTGTFDLNANLRIGGVAGAANVVGLGGVTFNGVLNVGSNTLTVGNGATGNAPTANTRIVTFAGQNTFGAGGGVVLDGGTISLAGTAAANSGLGGAGGTFTVTANGGRLQSTIAITSFALSTFQLNGELQLIGTSGMTMTAATTLNGSGALTLRNTSTTALTIQSDSSGYTGVVTTDISQLPNQSGSAGTLILNGSSGALTGVSVFNIRAGGGLTLSSNLAASTVNNNRVSDTAAINLRNGSLTLQGSVTAATTNTETVGAVTGAGYSIITATPGTGNGFTSLTAASLSRIERGTFLFRGTALGSAGSGTVGNILFTAAPTGDLVGGGGAAGSTNISILPYAIGDTSGTGTGSTATGSFVTYDANGIRPLTIGEFQANSFAGTDQNVRLTAATANAGSATINSLLVASGGSVTGAGTLNITSGAILNQNATGTTIANNVAFGGAEGVVFTPAATTISGSLTGSNGLTKSGAGTLTLTGNNSGLTGALTINNGMISIANASNLAGSGQIRVNGALGSSAGTGLTFTAATTLARDINIGSGFLSLNASGSPNVTLSGNITGNGGLYITGSGANYFLTGNNTYSGPTHLFFGNTHIYSDANLGTGALDFNVVTTAGLVAEANWTTGRHINFSAGSLMNTQGFNAVWNGVVTGTGAIFKSGTGTLTLNAANTASGAVTINASGGSVVLAQNGALMSTGYTVNNGGSLVLDNASLPVNVTPTTNVVTNRIADTSTVTLASGGTLRLLGNASSNLLERLGNVTVTGANNILQVEAVGGQSASFLIANLTATGGSVLVRGTNLGLAGVAGRVFLTNFNGAAATDGQFLANVNAESLTNLGVIESAVYDATFGIRLANAGDFLNGTAIQNAAPTNTPTNANFRVNPAVANPVLILDGANTVNSLRFAPNGVVDYTDFLPSTLTITSGSILTEAGGSGAALNDTSGGLTITSGATAMSFVTNSNLVVQAALAGTGGVRKLGAGILTLTGSYGNTGGLTLSGGILAASGAALNINGALAVPNITYQGGTTTAAIEFTNTATATVATFNGSANIANDFRLTLSNVISTFTNGTNDNQTTTLSGVISGGGATGTFRFSGNSNDSSVFVLSNPNNSFTGTISVFEGVLAVASNGALGNAANLIDMNTISTTVGGLQFDADFTGANTMTHNVRFNGDNVINTNGNTAVASGVLSDTGTFTKTGAGTLILTNNANTHTGVVTVSAGRLQIDGNIALSTTNAVTVNSGGTLGGTGIINRPVVIASGGTLAPGASIGTLTVTNDVTINGNPSIGGWDIEFNAVPTNTPGTAAGAPDVDILALTGAGSDLNLVSSAGNPLRINLSALAGTFDYGSPVSYVIATADAGTNFLSNGGAFTFDPTAFTFNPTNFLASGFTLSVDGNRFLMTFNPINPVPEPGVWTLMAIAAVGGLGWKRLRRSKAD